jgi:heme A synthase
LVDPLSPLAAFIWGCFGGAMAFTVIMLIPELRATWKQKEFDNWPPKGISLAIALGVAQVLLGGAVALWCGDATTAKQAISYGIAAEALVGGGYRALTEDPTAKKS